MTLVPTQVLDVRAELGEGPIWDARRRSLVFVDIHQRRVHVYTPQDGRLRSLDMDRAITALAPTADGDWIAAADLGFIRLDIESGAVSSVRDVEPVGSRRRMNDGAVDPGGRFWAGSMSLDGVAGQGTLFCLEPDLTVRPVITPVTTSNGPAWSPDGRLMYYVDTRTRRIDVCDFDVASGEPTHRRPFVDFAAGPGRPDGVIVDRDGGVWVALWQGSAVHRYRPDGVLDVVVTMPTVSPTKCAFAGDDLGDLYITTARAPLSEAERAHDSAAGNLFVVRTGHVGQVGTRFG